MPSATSAQSEDFRPSRTVAGAGTQRQQQVCKLIDTTTCIGCKACEVACLEWNDLRSAKPFSKHLPDHARNGVELLEPDPVQRTSRTPTAASLAHAQRSVHALRRSRLPGACPADGAIVQYQQRHRRFPAGITASAASIASPAAPSTSLGSTPPPRRCSSARCATTACRRGWSRPASRPAPPAACTLAPKTT